MTKRIGEDEKISNKVVGKIVRQARRSSGITQMEMAEYFGKNRASVSEKESGKGRFSIWELMIVQLVTEVKILHILNEIVEEEEAD